MKEINSIKYGKLIPVKLIKEAPIFQSKKLKNQLDTSASLSTEPSNRVISTRTNHSGKILCLIKRNNKSSQFFLNHL